MRNSGTKLVLVLCALATIAAAVGWWSRYQSTHLAADFWGPQGASLLQGPSQVELLESDGKPITQDESGNPVDGLAGQVINHRLEVTDARGLTHLRSALVEDRNFNWDLYRSPTEKGASGEVSQPDMASPLPQEPRTWKWALRFYGQGRSQTVLLTQDFSWLGNMPTGSQEVAWVSCQPLRKPLANYFQALQARGE